MKAVVMQAPGSAQQLQYVDLPEPVLENPQQVKVRLHAAGINPVDTKLRSRGTLMHTGSPAVLGCDGSGVIVECGAQVSHWKVGDEVWFCRGGLGGLSGNYAQYHVLPATEVGRKPANVSFLEAAAAPLVLLTAWEALLDRARLKAGNTVLIQGGAGGVGHVAVQLARHFGARVCATVGNEAKAHWVQNLGAEETIVYGQQDVEAAVLHWTRGRGVDIGLDTVGGEAFLQMQRMMARYGDLITLLEPGPDVSWKEARTRNLRIGFELMLTPQLQSLPQARAHQLWILEQCADLLATGRLQIHVSEVFPLQAAAKAHQLLETGHVQGKLVLQIAQDPTP